MSKPGNKTRTGKKRHPIRKLILLLLLLVILAAVGYSVWSRLKTEYTVVYDPYTATTGSISNSLSFSGSLQLVDSIIYSPTSTTTVRNVYVAAGDKVKKGDRLIRLANGDNYTAEFDGTVNTVNFKKDDEVYTSDTLIQLADFEHLKVQVRVDEYDISDVHVGDACTVTATATEKNFSSVISEINYISASNGNVAYYTATVYVDVDEGIYPGMQATVTVPQEEATDVVILKADALSFTPANQAFVYILKDDGAMETRDVEVGVSNGKYVEIRNGVASGETIYAVSKVKTDSGMASMLSGLFGGQRVNPGMPGNMGGMGGGNRNNNWGGGNNRNRDSGSDNNGGVRRQGGGQ